MCLPRIPHPRAKGGGLAVLLLAATVAGGACGLPAEDGLARVRDQGFVRVGYAHEPPYAFADEAGRVDGESPAALQHALRTLGVDSVRWVLMDFEDLVPALEIGRVEVVASGLFSTEARRRRVRFSRPTFCARPALLVRVGDTTPEGIQSFASEGGGRLAVLEGSVEHDAAVAMTVPAARILPVPDLATGVSAVRLGMADALALSQPTLLERIEDGTDLTLVTYDPVPATAALLGGCSALAFRLEDERLAAAVDDALSGYLGSAEHAEELRRLGLPDEWESSPGRGGG